MGRKNSKFKTLQHLIFFLVGLLLGIGAIWPGLITEKGVCDASTEGIKNLFK